MNTSANPSNGFWVHEYGCRLSRWAIEIKHALVTFLVLGMAVAGFAQSFQNMGFEAATLVPLENSSMGEVQAVPAFPGWTAYRGASVAPFVLYDNMTLDGVNVSIVDTNKPYGLQILDRAFQGKFTALLQAGFGALGPPNRDSAAVAQTGLIPASAKTLLFDANVVSTRADQFTVSLAGQNLPFFALASFTNYVLFGVDISGFAGQTQEIRFTAYPNPPPGYAMNMVYLDDVRLSSAAPGAPPFLFRPPQGLTVAEGHAALFSVLASGFPPLSYQWLFNTTNLISGATNSTFRLANVQLSQAGAYTVVMTNIHGAVTSPPAVLIVGEQADYTYTTNNGAITITGVINLSGSVIIPSVINGFPVTSIGNHAFERCYMTSVQIPDGITNIGRAAFAGCAQLNEVKVGNGVITIGDDAFSLSRVLANVVIGNGVTTIGNSAFRECTGLTNVSIGSSAKSIGNDAFYFCSRLPIVTIPDSVTSIGGEAFAYCSSLIEVLIGKSVANLGRGAFASCSSLRMVTIPDSVETIGDSAFAFTSLTTVTIPNSVKSIGAEAFALCPNLSSVTIGNSATNIGLNAFWGCPSLTAITVGGLNSVYSSAVGVLFNKSQTTLIQYPGGMTGSYTIPNGVTSIGDSAFSQCVRLTTVTLPASVTSIEFRAFLDCPNLEGVYFHGNAPTLGLAVFSDDSSATLYYLAGTTGWGETYGGLPTTLWVEVPIIQSSMLTQTAEAGSVLGLWAQATNALPLSYWWYFNETNFIGGSTNCELTLTNVQFSQSGAYTAVISNALGAVTSAPAMLNVIAPVDRRPVPGINLFGGAGSLLNLDCVDSLCLAPHWTPLDSVSLTSASQYYFDLTVPLPPQRFYRTWQSTTLGPVSRLDLHMIPAITLKGDMGNKIRVDGINQFGPTDAWFTLDTVTLTNSTQLYFDVTVVGQPPRLYRIVPSP
jgi:hypothetical protein